MAMSRLVAENSYVDKINQENVFRGVLEKNAQGPYSLKKG
jgi:hypothetical protein